MPIPKPTTTYFNSGTAVLLTGWPSVGARLAAERLLEWGCEVFALSDERCNNGIGVRPPNRERAHLQILPGRVSGIDLGLSGTEVKDLLRRVEVVLHWVNEPSPGANFAEQRDLHSHSTRELLRFAVECKRLRMFSLWSSAWVPMGSALAQGRRADESPNFPYETSKSEAEGLVLHSRNVPACVLRPSALFGNSQTGEMSLGWPSTWLIKLFLTWNRNWRLPIPAPEHGPLNLVPIDFAVDAALYLSGQPASVGRTFYITDPSPPSIEEALESFAAWAGARPPLKIPLPRGATNAALGLPVVRSLAPAHREWLARLSNPIHLDANAAWSFLRGADLHCPRLSDYGPLVVETLRFYLDNEASMMEP